MSTVTKTPTEVFIQTAAFIWTAVQELDQAASKQNDLGRFALAEFNRLDGKLQSEIRAWNGNLDLEATPPDMAVYECSDAAMSGCEIYTTNPRQIGFAYCNTCAERRADWAHERVQEVA
jgi:hypothetical protein